MYKVVTKLWKFLASWKKCSHGLCLLTAWSRTHYAYFVHVFFFVVLKACVIWLFLLQHTVSEHPQQCEERAESCKCKHRHTPTMCTRVLLERKGLWGARWGRSLRLFPLWSDHAGVCHASLNSLKQKHIMITVLAVISQWCFHPIPFSYSNELSEEETFFLSGLLWFGSPLQKSFVCL